jgi:hypothetical protein
MRVLVIVAPLRLTVWILAVQTGPGFSRSRTAACPPYRGRSRGRSKLLEGLDRKTKGPLR